MSVKFLSEEWASQIQDALNANEAFKAAVGSNVARLQQVISTPDGEVRYWMKLEGGQAYFGLGDVEGPDATVSQDLPTAVAMARNELTGVAAYMSGRIKVQGDLMKLMALQGVIGQLPAAMRAVDVDYPA